MIVYKKRINYMHSLTIYQWVAYIVIALFTGHTGLVVATIAIATFNIISMVYIEHLNRNLREPIEEEYSDDSIKTSMGNFNAYEPINKQVARASVTPVPSTAELVDSVDADLGTDEVTLTPIELMRKTADEGYATSEPTHLPPDTLIIGISILAGLFIIATFVYSS